MKKLLKDDKNYLVFLYEAFSSCGGWRDFKEATTTLHEAIKYVLQYGDWRIWNYDTFEIVNISNRTSIIMGDIRALVDLISGKGTGKDLDFLLDKTIVKYIKTGLK